MPQNKLRNGDIDRHDIATVARYVATHEGANHEGISLNEKHFSTAYSICTLFGYTPTFVLHEALEDFRKGER